MIFLGFKCSSTFCQIYMAHFRIYKTMVKYWQWNSIWITWRELPGNSCWMPWSWWPPGPGCAAPEGTRWGQGRLIIEILAVTRRSQGRLSIEILAVTRRGQERLSRKILAGTRRSQGRLSIEILEGTRWSQGRLSGEIVAPVWGVQSSSAWRAPARYQPGPGTAACPESCRNTKLDGVGPIDNRHSTD